MERKYLIVCLRNGCWERYDNLVFWGKNSSGYYTDLLKAGLYTKEEAKKICDKGDVYIPVSRFNIDIEALQEIVNPIISVEAKKTKDICKYINTFVRIMDNKEIMKWGNF